MSNSDKWSNTSTTTQAKQATQFCNNCWKPLTPNHRCSFNGQTHQQQNNFNGQASYYPNGPRMNGPSPPRMHQGFSNDPFMRNPQPRYNPHMYHDDAFESRYFQEDWNNLRFESSRKARRHLSRNHFNPHNPNQFQRQSQRNFQGHGTGGNSYQQHQGFQGHQMNGFQGNKFQER
jgi:hypothetical protein